jgi:hypothetical protein
MKKKIYSILIILSFIALPLISMADTGPGNPPTGPGTGDVPIGGGAPIGGGSLILLGLAAAYGGKKWYESKKEELEE